MGGSGTWFFAAAIVVQARLTTFSILLVVNLLKHQGIPLTCFYSFIYNPALLISFLHVLK